MQLVNLRKPGIDGKFFAEDIPEYFTVGLLSAGIVIHTRNLARVPTLCKHNASKFEIK